MLNCIKTVQCPICGCTEIIEESLKVSQIGPLAPEVYQHSNGTRWESRKFLCGYKVEYEPNFKREVKVESSECFHDPEVKERKRKLKEDKEQLIILLEENDISKELIDRIRMHCLY